MKIVVVIDVYDNLTNGTVMTAYRFVEEFRKREHEVRVVGTGAFGPNSFPVPERHIPLVTKISAKQQIRFGKPNVEILKEAFLDADIIHFYLPFKLEKKGRKIAKNMNIPATAAFHLQPENMTYNMGLKKFNLVAKLIYFIFKNSFFKYFDHIHCPSNFIANQLKINDYKCKTHVISNGVCPAFKPPKEGYITNKDNKEYFDIMMIGRYAPEKRQDIIIKAIAKSKYNNKIRLTLAGKGPKEKYLKKLGEKYLKNPIIFDFYNQEELIKKLHNMDLYIHAADIEIEAIACIEAISCGVVPIIADSKKSATPQFSICENSLFKVNSPEHLAKLIDYWIEHPKEREEMSKKYVEFSKRYLIENSIKEAEKMFKEAIEDHNKKMNIMHKN